MKDGYVLTKSAELSAGELDEINRYSRKELNPDEVYTFSVVLCDNEIDRDNERFSIEALYKLSELFCGKTGIFDHNMKAGSQTARIYHCDVVKEEGRTTRAGEIYHKLLAKAYMPRLASNADLISEIDSGIKKEVSVGCAVGSIICSVCGKDMRSGECSHVKGRVYPTASGDKRAFAVLSNPTDAYEWSFVAVPAQVGAGVCKAYAADRSYDGSARTVGEMLNLMKSADSGGISLNRKEAELLSRYIEGLTADAKDGAEYRMALRKEIEALSAVSDSTVSPEVLKKVLPRMNSSELCSLRCSLKASAKRSESSGKPQLAGYAKYQKASNNKKFMI